MTNHSDFQSVAQEVMNKAPVRYSIQSSNPSAWIESLSGSSTWTH